MINNIKNIEEIPESSENPIENQILKKELTETIKEFFQ